MACIYGHVQSDTTQSQLLLLKQNKHPMPPENIDFATHASHPLDLIHSHYILQSGYARLPPSANSQRIKACLWRKWHVAFHQSPKALPKDIGWVKENDLTFIMGPLYTHPLNHGRSACSSPSHSHASSRRVSLSSDCYSAGSKKSCLKPSRLEIGPEWLRLVRTSSTPEDRLRVLAPLLLDSPARPIRRASTNHFQDRILFQRPGVLKNDEACRVSFHWSVQQNQILDEPLPTPTPLLAPITTTRLGTLPIAHGTHLSTAISPALLKLDAHTVFLPKHLDVGDALGHLVDATIGTEAVTFVEAPCLPLSPEENEHGEKWFKELGMANLCSSDDPAWLDTFATRSAQALNTVSDVVETALNVASWLRGAWKSIQLS